MCLGLVGGRQRCEGQRGFLYYPRAPSWLFRSTFIDLSPNLGARHRRSGGRGNAGYGFLLPDIEATKEDRGCIAILQSIIQAPKIQRSAFVLAISNAFQATGPQNLASGFKRQSSYFPERIHTQYTLV